MANNVIAFTGHRPDKLPGGWDDPAKKQFDMVLWLTEKLREEYNTNGKMKLITGGACGWDQIALEAAINLEEYEAEIVVVEPVRYFWKRWMPAQIEHYHYLKYFNTETSIIVLQEEPYKPWHMQKRNEFMVDECYELWAYWNGEGGGGTTNCVNYASAKDVTVRNMFNEYKV